MTNLNLTIMLLQLPGILLGLTIHEFAHAFTAVKMGDDTPLREKRYTLNPIPHIDLFGFLMILMVGFGWAKPVHFNPNNFKHPRRDEILVSLAGPLANLGCSILAIILLKLLVIAKIGIFGIQPYGAYFLFSFRYLILINLVLAIFNLIPIPPLDGSHILLSFIPDRYYQLKYNLLQYGSISLIALILIGRFTKIDLLPIGYVADRLLGLFEKALNFNVF